VNSPQLYYCNQVAHSSVLLK